MLTPCWSCCLWVFSPIQWVVFILLMISFAVQGLLSLVWCNWFVFAFVSFALGDQGNIAVVVSGGGLPVFSSGSFVV